MLAPRILNFGDVKYLRQRDKYCRFLLQDVGLAPQEQQQTATTGPSPVSVESIVLI